jgi:hypothetical protein
MQILDTSGNCKRWSAFKKGSFTVGICASGVNNDLHSSTVDTTDAHDKDDAVLSLRPWKHECESTDEKRSVAFTLTVDAMFGGDENSAKNGREDRVNGILVGEVFWVGGITNSSPEGVLLHRFKIEASKIGVSSTRHAIFPMKNGHVMLDSMMSLTAKTDSRLRELKAVFHAPNETGDYWKPIYTCSFPVEVSFCSRPHRQQLLDNHYLDTTDTNQKLASIQSAMKEDAVAIRIGSIISSESRLVAHSVASESVARERKLFMMKLNGTNGVNSVKGVENDVNCSPDHAFVSSRRRMQNIMERECA